MNANINTLTTHHCVVGAWLRGGQITVNNYRSADNIIGMLLVNIHEQRREGKEKAINGCTGLNFASEGGNPNDPGSYQTTNGAIFVGVSANSDWSPIYSFPIMGISPPSPSPPSITPLSFFLFFFFSFNSKFRIPIL